MDIELSYIFRSTHLKVRYFCEICKNFFALSNKNSRYSRKKGKIEMKKIISTSQITRNSRVSMYRSYFDIAKFEKNSSCEIFENDHHKNEFDYTF